MSNAQNTTGVSTCTVRIHGQSSAVEINLDGMTVDELVNKVKKAFGVPDNATPLVNGRSGVDAVKPGDTVTFQTQASQKA